jgi:hypothetical protein
VMIGHVIGGTALELELYRLDACRRRHGEARSLHLGVGCTLEVEIRRQRAMRSTSAVLVLRHDEHLLTHRATLWTHAEPMRCLAATLSGLEVATHCLEARRIADPVTAHSGRVEKSTRQTHGLAEQAEEIRMRVEEIVHRAPGNAQRGPESTPRAGRADDEWRRRGV